MYSLDLDPICGYTILIKLYKDVENAKELHHKLLKGELECCMIKPSLICDPLQVVVAANKALLAEKTVTKSIYTEILFNLSISKNITQSLQTFGFSDKDTSLLIVLIRKTDSIPNAEQAVTFVRGKELDISELKTLADTKCIKKAYKISDDEFKKGDLLDSVVSKIAAKEVL